MRRRHAVFVAVVGSFLVLCAAGVRAAEWRIQTLFTPGYAYFDEFQNMANRIESATKGALVIKASPVGAIVGPTGTLNAISSGVLQGHLSWFGLWAGREPGFAPLADLAGAYENAAQQLEMMQGHGGLALLQQMYDPHQIQVVGVSALGPESLPSRKAINGVADLKGLKVRLPAGLTAAVFAALGAAPVNLPMSEAFSALDKGVVDAADNSGLADNYRQGMHESAKFALYPGFHSQPIVDFAVNKRAWNALSEEQRRIVLAEWKTFQTNLIERVSKDDAKAAEELRAKGVTIVNWNSTERRKFREAARAVWNEAGTKSDFSKRAVELQVRYLQSKGLLD